MRALALAALTAMLLAGCTGSGQTCRGAPDLDDVRPGAPSEVGTDETTVVVRVLRPADPPMPVAGALVVAVWAVPVGARVDDGAAAAARSVRDGARAEGEERFLLVTANLTADASGEARLHIPATSILQVASTAPGLTTQHSEQFGRDAPLPHVIELALVPPTSQLAFDATLGQGAAPPSVTGAPQVFEQAISWGPQPAWWDDRLAHVEAVLRWQNTPMAQAELDVEVGAPGGPRASSSGDSGPAGALGRLGAHERTVALDPEERGGLASTSVWVYDGSSARTEDLPFSVEVEGLFAGNGPMGNVCVPSSVVLDGPLDVAAYGADQDGPEGDRLPMAIIGPLVSFAIIGVIAVVAVLATRRS